LTFDRRDYDEGKEAREMATRVGADFHPIAIGQDDLADHFGDAVHQAEAFGVNAHGVAKYLLDRLETMDEGSRLANDQVLMILLSACVVQKRLL
jgi:Asparagine synthase